MKLILEIFKFLLKIDLRTRKEGKISYGRLILIFVTNFLWFFILSSTIAISGIDKQNLRLFLLDFSFVIFSLEFLLIAFTIIVEFDLLLLNPLEVEFFSFLPINQTIYGLAKYFNFLFFISLLSFSYNLSPALVLSILNFFTSGIYENSFLKISLSYLFVSFLYVVLISNFVLLGLLFLGRGIKIERLKKFIFPLQIFAVFAVFFIYQALNKYLTSNESDGIFTLLDRKFSFIAILPQFVFPKIFIILSGVGYESLKFFEIIVIVFLILLISPVFFLKIENLKNILVGYNSGRGEGVSYWFIEILKRFKKLFFKTGSTFAIYELVYVYLRRDRSIRVKILSAFVISIAIAVYLLTLDRVGNPILEPASRANVMMLISLFFNVIAGITAIQNHRDYEANWVYNFIGMDEIYETFRSGFMVLWHHILIPLLVIFFFTYLIRTGEFLAVFLHIFITLLILKVFFNFALLFFVNLPLSQPYEKLSSAEKIFAQIFALIAVFIAVIFEKGIYGLVIISKSYFVLLPFLIFLMLVERYSLKILKRKVGRIFKCQISGG